MISSSGIQPCKILSNIIPSAIAETYKKEVSIEYTEFQWIHRNIRRCFEFCSRYFYEGVSWNGRGRSLTPKFSLDSPIRRSRTVYTSLWWRLIAPLAFNLQNRHAAVGIEIYVNVHIVLDQHYVKINNSPV